MTTSMSAIWEYGCWCYFQEDHGRGRGTPQNAVDDICQILHHGYTCIKMDAITENVPCDPFNHAYSTVPTLGNSQQQLEVDCIAGNPGDVCAQRICLVESKFVMNFIQIGTTPGFTFDPSLKHDLNIFDPNTCRNGNGGKPDRDEECCGVYPIRYPFRTNGNLGDRQCCVQKTYDAGTMSCCPDGTVKLSCP